MKAHCPRCDGERVCLIHGSFDQPWSNDHEEYSINGQIDHRLLQCRGCEVVFYWQSSWDSEDWDFRYNRVTGVEESFSNVRIETYPTPDKKTGRPDWSWSLHKQDAVLNTIMHEVYDAAEAKAYILASIGLRTALDRITEMLGINTDLTFAKKVEALFLGGWVGDTERQTLEVVADAGSAAAHRGWSPDKEAFAALLTTLEHFIQRAILTGKKALEVAPQVPQRRTASKKAATQKDGGVSR
jgi:hypothetical protein